MVLFSPGVIRPTWGLACELGLADTRATNAALDDCPPKSEAPEQSQVLQSDVRTASVVVYVHQTPVDQNLNLALVSAASCSQSH